MQGDRSFTRLTVEKLQRQNPNTEFKNFYYPFAYRSPELLSQVTRTSNRSELIRLLTSSTFPVLLHFLTVEGYIVIYSLI